MGEILQYPIDTMQKDHDRWVEHNFPGETEVSMILGIVEELGELAHHLLKRSQGIRSDGVDHDAEIRDACADLYIFMLGLATHEGFDLRVEIEKTWAKVRERDWIEFPHDGMTR